MQSNKGKGYLDRLNSLDKRTKEYKDLKVEVKNKYEEFKKKNNEQSKGLGDSIAKVTKATKIDKLVKFIAGEDCGCDERQELLNKTFAYDVPKCLTEDEFNYLIQWFKSNPAVATLPMQKQILKIHNRIFDEQKSLGECTSCGSVIRKILIKLKKIVEQY